MDGLLSLTGCLRLLSVAPWGMMLIISKVSHQMPAMVAPLLPRWPGTTPNLGQAHNCEENQWSLEHPGPQWGAAILSSLFRGQRTQGAASPRDMHSTIYSKTKINHDSEECLVGGNFSDGGFESVGMCRKLLSSTNMRRRPCYHGPYLQKTLGCLHINFLIQNCLQSAYAYFHNFRAKNNVIFQWKENASILTTAR